MRCHLESVIVQSSLFSRFLRLNLRSQASSSLAFLFRLGLYESVVLVGEWLWNRNWKEKKTTTTRKRKTVQTWILWSTGVHLDHSVPGQRRGYLRQYRVQSQWLGFESEQSTQPSTNQSEKERKEKKRPRTCPRNRQSTLLDSRNTNQLTNLNHVSLNLFTQSKTNTELHVHYSSDIDT